MNKKYYLMPLIAVSIFFSVNSALAVVNNTLKDELLPYINIQYDYANAIIDEVLIYNRSLLTEEIAAIYSASPYAEGETWNCTMRAIDATGLAGPPNSITIPGTPAQNYTAAKWTHVAVTYNKNTKQKKIYVNGEIVRTETLSGIGNYIINNNTENLYIGKLYRVPAGNPFNGSIDEVMIFSKERSAWEIMQDYLNSIIYNDMPRPNEARTFVIKGENISEVSIAPIIKVEGKEATCHITSKVKGPMLICVDD